MPLLARSRANLDKQTAQTVKQNKDIKKILKKMLPVKFVVVGFQYFNCVGAHHDVTVLGFSTLTVLEHMMMLGFFNTMLLGFSTLTVLEHMMMLLGFSTLTQCCWVFVL